MKNKTIKKTEQAFTLIEAMTVIFILGLLSMTAALGYGQINRDKALDQASQRVGLQMSQSRDYAVFGKEIESKFPCGYGVTFTKSNINDNGADLILQYTSTIDRVGIMAKDVSCDDLLIGFEKEEGVYVLKNNLIDLGRNTVDEADYLSSPDDKMVHLKNVIIKKITDSAGGEVDSLTTLFSAPRGGSYYATVGGSDPSCVEAIPPVQCNFKIFSENSTVNSTFFKVTLRIRDGNADSEKVVTIRPSGNIEIGDN